MLGSSRIGGSGAIIAGVNAPKRTCPYGTVGQIGGRGIAWVRRRCATMQCLSSSTKARSVQQVSSAQRARRITGHVRVKRDLIGNGDAVLLVDDIVTTGALCGNAFRRFSRPAPRWWACWYWRMPWCDGPMTISTGE